MDYSKLNAEELIVAQQMLSYLDEPMRSSEAFRPSAFNECFPGIMSEFLSLDADGWDEAWNELNRTVMFRLYAESLGNPDMTDALIKTADELSKMDSKSLEKIAKGGLSNIASK